MTTEINMEAKNFGLSEDEFNTMVSDLCRGNEEMFEHIYLKHFESCINYLRNDFNTDYTDAYDCVMYTLLQFRESLKEGKIKYGNVRYLFTRMAANRFLKTKKRMSKFDFKDILPERAVGEKQYSDEEMQLLNKAWSQMGEACQQLLKSYFYDKIKMVELAKNASKTPAAIRKQKERCINVLRNNFLRFI